MKRLKWVNEEDRVFVREWQKATRLAIGRELRRLQKGEKPLNYRPLPEFGSQVAELKRGPLRVVYTTEPNDAVAIVCAFRKDSKGGSKMRPEHRRSIERALRKLRAEYAPVGKTLH